MEKEIDTNELNRISGGWFEAPKPPIGSGREDVFPLVLTPGAPNGKSRQDKNDLPPFVGKENDQHEYPKIF